MINQLYKNSVSNKQLDIYIKIKLDVTQQIKKTKLQSTKRKLWYITLTKTVNLKFHILMNKLEDHYIVCIKIDSYQNTIII